MKTTTITITDADLSARGLGSISASTPWGRLYLQIDRAEWSGVLAGQPVGAGTVTEGRRLIGRFNPVQNIHGRRTARQIGELVNAVYAAARGQ